MDKKVHVLIFSKDRALQLDATLRSLLVHAGNLKIANVIVLYRTTTAKMAAQYQELVKEYAWVRFLAEKNFRRDLINIFSETISHPRQRRWIRLYATLNNIRFPHRRSLFEIIIRGLTMLGIRFGRIPFENWCSDQYWLLTVDDNIFLSPFNFEEIIAALESNPKAIGFSLRLGKNINYCYMKDIPQKPPQFNHNVKNPNLLSFEWGKAEHDFGYPLEISSTVYRNSLLVPLVCGLYFNTPNTLESKMTSLKNWFVTRFPLLLCYSTSVSFCLPLNKVQLDRPLNRSGNQQGYSIEELARLFDEKKRIEVLAFSHFIPASCHQEVDLEFFESPK